MRRMSIAVALGSALFVLIPASPVSAHADLEISSPSPSAILENSPREIVLDFTEPVSRVERSIELYDERQQPVRIPSATSPASDRIEVRDVPILEAGLYLVMWRALSQDGHIAEGAFTFQIGLGTPSIAPDDLIAGIDSSTSITTSLAALRHGARVATYLGLSAALGTLVFAVAVRARRVRGIIGVGGCAALIGTALQFMIQGVDASGGGWTSLIDIGAWSDVSSTRLGQGLIARLILLVLLAVLYFIAHRRVFADSAVNDRAGNNPAVIDTSWWRSSTALVGIGIIVTFAMTGHPSASSPAAVAIAVDAIHLGAVVLWLGGLFSLVGRHGDVSIVRTFSRVASVALPVAVVTGVWQAWHLLDVADDITANHWGRALVIKTMIVVFTTAIALTARWIVKSEDLGSLRRLVGVEVFCAIAIVAATSVLVSSPPQSSASSRVVSVALVQDDIIVNVTVTPGGVGSNEIHLTVVTPGGTLAPVEGLDIRLTEEGSDGPPIAVDVQPLGPNHFLGSVVIVRSGAWAFEFLVQVSSSRIVRLTTTVDI